MLVDVLHRELHRGHDTTADVALRHVIAVREEARNVDVTLFAAAEVDRLLPGALADQQPAVAVRERDQQHQRTIRRSAGDRHRNPSGRPHPVPFSLLHPASPNDILRCGRDARFHLVLFRVIGCEPDKPDMTLVAARLSIFVLMTTNDTGSKYSRHRRDFPHDPA